MSRYDTRTTIFSREGRLYQVEYAIEAINKAPPAVGMICTDGIILFAEKRSFSKLVERLTDTEKIHRLDRNMAVAVAGISSDANKLIDHARVQGQRYLYTYQHTPPVEYIVQQICSVKQSYTQFGGLRPFGVSFLLAGWDKHHGYQLYSTDPSGNYAGWKTIVIGQGSSDAQRQLKDDIKEDTVQFTTEEGLIRCGTILSKALGVDNLKEDGIEAVVIKKDESGEDIVYEVVGVDKLKEIVKEVNDIIESKNKGDI